MENPDKTKFQLIISLNEDIFIFLKTKFKI